MARYEVLKCTGIDFFVGNAVLWVPNLADIVIDLSASVFAGKINYQPIRHKNI